MSKDGTSIHSVLIVATVKTKEAPDGKQWIAQIYDDGDDYWFVGGDLDNTERLREIKQAMLAQARKLLSCPDGPETPQR